MQHETLEGLRYSVKDGETRWASADDEDNGALGRWQPDTSALRPLEQAMPPMHVPGGHPASTADTPPPTVLPPHSLPPAHLAAPPPASQPSPVMEPELSGLPPSVEPPLPDKSPLKPIESPAHSEASVPLSPAIDPPPARCPPPSCHSLEGVGATTAAEHLHVLSFLHPVVRLRSRLSPLAAVGGVESVGKRDRE